MSASLCGSRSSIAEPDVALPSARHADTARLTVMVILPILGRNHPMSPESIDDAQTEAR
ncbi:hypothetical protein [Williamsia limnetica]|uniref:hypothetical protein n=1 Tax=Williamsia limnetica TaxID=882452 RepID=UPI0013145121|nr:hypothetical protein [Williamsia limnetica]